MKKRIFSILLAFVMLVGMLPVQVFAATADLPVSSGKVNVNDVQVGPNTLEMLDVYLQGSFAAVNIVSATQDGNTINVVLSEDTNPAAALQAGFSGSGQGTLTHSGNKCTLANGIGTMTYAVTVRIGPQNVAGTTFTINFSVPMGKAYTVSIPTGEGYTVSGENTVYEGSSYTFRVSVAEGYSDADMVVKVNGQPVSGSNGSYTVSEVTGDLKIEVEGITKKETCAVTLTPGDGYTLTGNPTVYKGESYTFTVVIAEGYDATNMVVKANDAPVSGNGGIYTIPAVNEDITITVDDVVKKEVCNVTLTPGDGYTLSGNPTVYKGESYTFTVAIAEGYDATNMVVKANDAPVSGNGGSYTIPAVEEDTMITVSGLVKKEVCNVTLTPGDGYTLSGNPTVYKGESYTFTVAIAEGYDGTNMVVKANDAPVSGNGGSYTILAVNEDITITVDGVVAKEVCSITLTPGDNYTISGAETAYKGDSYTFTVTVKKGCTDANMVVKANGQPVNGSNGSYTIEAVDGNTTITVEGVERAPLPDRELPVANNVIDITDRTVYSLASYYAKAVNIEITGATVSHAYEDGTTVYILLTDDTADDAQIDVTFGTSLNRCTMDGHTGKFTLDAGEGDVRMTLTGKYSSSLKSTATYNLIFLREASATEPPVCIKPTDSAEMYKNTSLTLELENYFTGAKVYYLVEGETKTSLDGSEYTFVPTEAGEYNLVFSAQNDIGESPDTVCVTVTVKEIVSGTWIGHETSNGSVDYVTFTDAEGNAIDGITVTYSSSKITVLLPKNYDPSGKVTATFARTANASDIPFVTSTNSFNRAYSSRTDTYTNTLSGGAATRTVYLYNLNPGATSNNYTTWTITYGMLNDLPVLAEGVSAAATAEITAGENYTLDLTPLFTDVDNDELTYLVSINGAAAIAADANYRYTNEVAGTYTLVFTANDGKGTSTATYTVTLTVKDSEDTDSMTVYVPEGLEPAFYAATGYGGDGVDTQGAALTAVAGETDDGLIAYMLRYPVNVTEISVRTSDWGGMAFPAQNDGAVTLRKAQMAVVDYDENPAVSTNTVTYDGHTAAAGTDGWLLVTGKTYTFTAVPENTTDFTTVSQTAAVEAGSEAYTLELMLGINNAITITATTGAKAQLYNIDTSKYYAATEFDAKIIEDNGDGTTTHYFSATGNNLVYRVSMDGMITKMGYLGWNQKSVNAVYGKDDKDASYRLDDYSGTGAANSTFTEDSVLLNINSRNHLSMSVGESTTLKAYRAWEIIKISYQNYILTPNFTYTILSGDGVVELTEKESPSTADGDWMTLTALKEGMAVIEVSYSATEVTGGSYDGIYGASDPARSGILVVQVGSGNDSSVDFGIDCFSSVGISGAQNISYNPNNTRDWDAEFDTLYFVGDSGELSLTPTADSTVSSVAISHDKGDTWTELSGTNGTYTAKIISGNNILRVTTPSGTAYQVLRGKQITVRFSEVSGKSDGDGEIEVGETIRVTLVGLHAPIPKMAGNYNPGFGNNADGYSSQHLNYTCNGQAIYGPGSQYNFITDCNYVEVTIPEDGKVTLTNGYIGVGVIGLTNFVDGGDSHRNIPDGGCGTRGNKTTFHTRSVLPSITITAGSATAPNSAPVVRTDAVTEAGIYADQNYAINPDTLFVDLDGNPLSFTVSVNGGTATEAAVDYKFSPDAIGTYILTFTASDGKATVQHTITLTVTERPKEEEEDKDPEFGLTQDQIAGYVTVSFEDFGVRVVGETGLKYPVPLGTIIAPTKVPYIQGENVAQVTKRLLDHLGIGCSYNGSLTSGFYLGAISGFEVGGTPYGSMGEFDAGSGSGWMITLNGVFINRGASDFAVKDGDVVKWKYTCQLGKDIGDNSYYMTVEAVIELINSIGEVTANSGEKIKAARAAYDKLESDEQKRVSNYQVLAAAEASYDELMAAEVETLIGTIGTVTLDSKAKIDACRKAYDGLTLAQKQKVDNYAVLTAAEAKFAQLKKEADEAAANKVEEKIDKLDRNTFTFENDVKAAKKAYDELTAEQKKLVRNYSKLAEALKELASEEDKEAAKNVEKLINAIGNVTLDSEEEIKTARTAYDELTEVQKPLVGNVGLLEAAEEKLAQLMETAENRDLYKSVGDYLESLGVPTVNTVGGEWMVVGLARSGRAVTDAYYENVIEYVQENIDENERLHRAKSTDNSRVILALTALGKDVTNVNGHNLLEGLTDMAYVQKQGINGPIWALIAFDSGNYPIPDGGDVSRGALLQVILDAQLEDGGWALSGSTSDPDMTGMALQALAPYYKINAEVRSAVDVALITLAQMQAADGSLASIDGENSESLAQVIVALAALGIDADKDVRFVKNGVSLIDALCAYYVEGSGFKHTPDGKLDGMATEQAYYALTAYFRMLDGKTPLYSMTDVIDMGGDVEEEEAIEILPVETEPAENETVVQEDDSKGGFPWWLVIVIVVLAGGIIVLLIASKPKKRRR